MVSLFTRVATTTSLALAVATLVACKGGGAAPEIDPVDRQVAQVGVELSLTLTATDADGDEIDFSFDTTSTGIVDRAQLTRSPSGAGVFRWTPLAGDVGTWFVDFTASDGDNHTTLTVEIEVVSAIGGEGAPIFRQPLGSGTTLDLEAQQCVEVAIVIEDQDSTSVEITEEEPRIEGATLDLDGGLTGSWSWCPTREQAAAEDRWTLTLGADDLSHPKVLKNYLIVLRNGDGTGCPGNAPVITHTAQDASTISGLTIDAQVTDDLGLKQPPLLYYSETNPGANPNLGAMTQTTMLLIDGSMQNGTWAADVPNPVATDPQGTMQELYYVIVADDDDDDTGDCDHTTESPLYSMTVTNPGGGGTTGLCEPCSADVQCASGNCVRVGVMNEPFCLQDCSGASDCPGGYTCSAAPVDSVDGASARQCIPDVGSCTGGGSCIDDYWEENDTRAEADPNGTLIDGDLLDLTSCPLSTGTGDDEDFYLISISQDSMITLEISGEATTDLDLALQTSTGSVLQSSTSLDSDETIARCLTPGTYYARVYAWGTGQNDYLLSYDRVAQSCAAACVDDANENDDSLAQARTTVYPVHTSNAQTICTDDDWYAFDLYNGEVLTVDLTFTQANAQQDLDLHLHDAGGTDLTPCVEPDGSTCTTANGQSGTSNEHFVYTAPATGCSAGCPYYIRVHGWAGSKNTYDIRLEIE